MRQFAKPALALVDSMRAAAAADPLRAIAFGGAPGSNSHQAAMQFAPEALPLPCFSFEDALEAVESGAAGCAMIPIENSQHGRVADIHFLLPESGLYIVAEHFMRITHCLMALGKGPFEAAYSHPQALGQSHRFLGERGIVGLSHADTAGAAAFVAESGKPNVAAIAPALAADLYGLQIVEREVEDAPDNTTRFVVLAKDALDPAMLVGASAMTTFIFEVKNIPAALYKALGCFATNGVNMTKLESYQKGASFAATQFFADIEGVPGDPRVDTAFEELAFQTNGVRLLGSYAQVRKRG
ncbi:prephenate dehydratase [Qipengyuania flava]|uniref:prephenate dehydratase n=1 Tax=Qipengyuania flava TaxID=192812 RepID=UPI001C58624D|nr:prephenate dehydratase [Qipengyuania flava]MBW3167282.1 prephenate dehydratase [Qipengyuania flava]MBY5964520.1 prephenate dehydratase [Qipengyuania flava]MBY6010844.1 prephenate dehydratase [Qipengyuania flava]MBY6025286.1 prephenate dehydratase [Qipengyuania flava]